MVYHFEIEFEENLDAKIENLLKVLKIRYYQLIVILIPPIFVFLYGSFIHSVQWYEDWIGLSLFVGFVEFIVLIFLMLTPLLETKSILFPIIFGIGFVLFCGASIYQYYLWSTAYRLVCYGLTEKEAIGLVRHSGDIIPYRKLAKAWRSCGCKYTKQFREKRDDILADCFDAPITKPLPI